MRASMAPSTFTARNCLLAGGDHWEHKVKVEDLVPPEGPRARCLAGANAYPTEDVGGPLGYFDFLHALRDPSHEEHASMLALIGGRFDPTEKSAVSSELPGLTGAWLFTRR
ncbi:MAG TPA: plasmid pRiA4b ORF-3 family protein [Steroidobacteraceae bacterium]